MSFLSHFFVLEIFLSLLDLWVYSFPHVLEKFQPLFLQISLHPSIFFSGVYKLLKAVPQFTDTLFVYLSIYLHRLSFLSVLYFGKFPW